MSARQSAQDIADAVHWLRSAEAVRARCRVLFEAGREGKLDHFTLNLDRLDDAASFVARVTRECYPALDIPYHSRWRHFSAGGVDRWGDLERELASRSAVERARAAADLAGVSVLLDAGAGSDWRYREAGTGMVLERSEGLAVASFHMFRAGAFSSERHDPFRVDAGALEALTPVRLAEGFQATATNPLVGLEARAELLRRLGAAIKARPAVFGVRPARFGNLVPHLTGPGSPAAVAAPALLALLLDALAPIWPSGLPFHGVNLGDVGRHRLARAGDPTNSLVPFHKLTQWLTYSLFEPIEWAGAAVTDMDALTGLPEYRNGGLFVDCGVIVPRGAFATAPLDPRAEPVVEWRALTVTLLDQIAVRVRKILGKSERDLPLARILQGGTWTAGRLIARERRASGGPPILVATDGTTF